MRIELPPAGGEREITDRELVGEWAKGLREIPAAAPADASGYKASIHDNVSVNKWIEATGGFPG